MNLIKSSKNKNQYTRKEISKDSRSSSVKNNKIKYLNDIIVPKIGFLCVYVWTEILFLICHQVGID